MNIKLPVVKFHRPINSGSLAGTYVAIPVAKADIKAQNRAKTERDRLIALGFEVVDLNSALSRSINKIRAAVPSQEQVA
jgi:hypothetical protein